MFVKDQMSPHPITITQDASVSAAERVIRENNIRHLPVTGSDGSLLGLITRTSLEQVLPSKLTTLSIYELNYQLQKIKVGEAMVRKVLTTTEDVPIEEAARVMFEAKVGSLPVMRDKRLVGIITDIDLMRTMLGLLGARLPGVRLTLKVPDTPGGLSAITTAIAAEKGDIVAMGAMPADEPLKWWVVLKVRYVEQERLVAALKALPDATLIDARSC